MKHASALFGLGILVAMQSIGQSVVWDAVWYSGWTDTRAMAGVWWAWTAVQIVIAIPVGVHLARWGVSRCGRPCCSERLPRAWVNRALDAESNELPRSGTWSGMVSG